jgi:lipopolysaccharide transport protein LptA
MVKSLSDWQRLLLRVAPVLLVASAAGASDTLATGSISAGVGKPPVKYQCEHAQMDYKGTVLHLHGNVKIWQGDISVEADEADGRGENHEFKDSHWVFGGKVHVRSESQGDLRADHGTVEIKTGQLNSAVVTGAPALFEQTRATDGWLAKGHATSIDYEVAAATVTLTGDAVLNDDHNGVDLHGPTIAYNVRDMALEADGGPGVRARETITPGSGPGKKKP